MNDNYEIDNSKDRLTDLEIILLLHECGYDMSDELGLGEPHIISIHDFDKMGFDDPY